MRERGAREIVMVLAMATANLELEARMAGLRRIGDDRCRPGWRMEAGVVLRREGDVCVHECACVRMRVYRLW